MSRLDVLGFEESFKLMLSFPLMKFTFEKKIYPENRMYNKQFSTGVSGEIRFVVIANQIVAWGRLSWVLESYSMHVANGFSLN